MELKRAGVIPVVVFDGAPMPMKEHTSAERKQAREEAMRKAKDFLALGNAKEAYKHYAKAVSVTHKMAHDLLVELEKYSVECLVAPYEADAQLAYLCKTGYVSAVISEDSDLLVFGCTRVLYKFDTKSGKAKEISLESVFNHPHYNLRNWDQEKFVIMCILAGCDYLKNCKNIGIKSAYRIVSQTSSMQKVFTKLKHEAGTLPENYEVSFSRALLAFRHHRVYCPIRQKMVCLNEVKNFEEFEEVGGTEFLGEELPAGVTKSIARGECHPISKEPFETPNLKRKFDLTKYVSLHSVPKKLKVTQEKPKQFFRKVTEFKPIKVSKYFQEDESTTEGSQESVCLIQKPTQKFLKKPEVSNLETFKFKPLNS